MIREVQIKSQSHYTLIKMVKFFFKKLTIPSIGENMEKIGLSWIDIVGNVKRYNHLESSWTALNNSTYTCHMI